MFRLAIDNQISKVTVKKLQKHYEVVLWAANLPDEIWVEDAYDDGADVFISPDLDVPNILDRIDAKAYWMEIPQYLNEGSQFNFIMKELQQLKNRRGL